MLAFLEIVTEKYGSVEGCVRALFGFGEDDVEAIGRNLTVP